MTLTYGLGARRGKPLSSDVALAQMAHDGVGLTGADIAAVCHKASLLAIRDFLETSNAGRKGYKGFLISKKHFVAASKMISSRKS